MSIKWPVDNFLTGLFAGAMLMTLSYSGLRAIRLAAAEHYDNPYLFQAPRIELITILLNLILFRITIVNFKKEKAGRGILFVTVVVSFVFFLLFYRFQFRLP